MIGCLMTTDRITDGLSSSSIADIRDELREDDGRSNSVFVRAVLKVDLTVESITLDMMKVGGLGIERKGEEKGGEKWGGEERR